MIFLPSFKILWLFKKWQTYSFREPCHLFMSLTLQWVHHHFEKNSSVVIWLLILLESPLKLNFQNSDIWVLLSQRVYLYISIHQHLSLCCLSHILNLWNIKIIIISSHYGAHPDSNFLGQVLLFQLLLNLGLLKSLMNIF